MNRVVEAIGSVMRKKELLATSVQSIGNAINQIKQGMRKPIRNLEKSDVRNIFRELKLIKQVSVPPNQTNNLSNSSSSSSLFRQNTQPFLEQETLIDQIQALFFTDQVNSVDYIHMQDFFVILMSDTVQ